MRASHGDATQGSLVPIRELRVWKDPLLLLSSKEGAHLIRKHVAHGQLCGALDEYMKVCVVDRLVPVSCVEGGWVVFEIAWERLETPGQRERDH